MSIEGPIKWVVKTFAKAIPGLTSNVLLMVVSLVVKTLAKRQGVNQDAVRQISEGLRKLFPQHDDIGDKAANVLDDIFGMKTQDIVQPGAVVTTEIRVEKPDVEGRMYGQ